MNIGDLVEHKTNRHISWVITNIAKNYDQITVTRIDDLGYELHRVFKECELQPWRDGL
jgi:hypothetical protein